MPPSALVSSAAPGKKAAPKAPARRRPAAAAAVVVWTPAPSAEQTTPSVAPPSPRSTQLSAVDQSIQQEERFPPLTSEQPAQPQQEPEPTPAPIELVRDASRLVEQSRPASSNVQQTLAPAPILQQTRGTAPTPIAETIRAATSSASHASDVASALSPEPPNSSAASQEQTREGPTESREEPVLSFAEQALGPLLQPIPGQSEQEEPASQQAIDQATASAANTTKTPAKSKRGTKRARFREDEPAGSIQARKAPKRSTARSNAKVQAAMQGGEQAGKASIVTAGPDDTSGAQVTSIYPAPLKKRRSTSKKTMSTQRKSKSKAKSAETITNSDDEGEYATVPEPEMQIDPALTGQDDVPAPKAPKDATKPREGRVPRKKVQRSAQNSVEPATSVHAGTEMDIDPQEQVQQEETGDSSDPEEHVVDPNNVSMWDISHDRRHGKQSERGKAMAAIDWAQLAEERKAAAQAIVDGLQPPPKETAAQPTENADVVPTTEGAEEADGTSAENVPDPEAEPSEQPTTETAEPDTERGGDDDDDGQLEFRIGENGEIELDLDKTGTVDQNQAARDAAANVEDAQVIDDLTVLNNRTTWINENRRDPIDRVPLWKWKSDPWSEEETDRFYEQLRMFGTDFFIISKMFPGKNRRMIKAKFTREEKLDPTRVDFALSGKSTAKWNLEHYARETGIPVAHYAQFQTLEHTMSIINEETQKKHQDQAAEEQRKAIEREKEEKEKAAAEKEKRKSAKKAKRTRQKAAVAGTLGGGPDD